MIIEKKERFKELIRRHKWILKSATIITIISLTSGIVTLFCFVSGISSIPDLIKKILPNTSNVSGTSSDFYTVKLILPARMNGAEIFVDGQAATLVEQKGTVLTVRVQRKATGHQFAVKKGAEICEKPSQLIEHNDVIIYPCQ